MSNSKRKTRSMTMNNESDPFSSKESNSTYSDEETNADGKYEEEKNVEKFALAEIFTEDEKFAEERKGENSGKKTNKKEKNGKKKYDLRTARRDIGTPRQAKGPYVKTPKRGAQRGPHPPSPKGRDVKEALKHLPREGWVSQNPSGMVFLDLDDDWIFSIENLLAEFGYEIPPYFYPPHPVGAHITLVTTDEVKKYVQKYGINVGVVDLGRKVRFSIRRCGVSFPRNRSYGLEARFKVWVKGEELKRIRRRVTGQLMPRGGFYIVVGVRRLLENEEKKYIN